MKEILLIEKYDNNRVCSILYKNAETRDFYIKRFKIETSTTEKKFSLVQDVLHSKILAGTTETSQVVKSLGKDNDGNEIEIKKGRYGPYITNQKINAPCPKNQDIELIELSAAIEILSAKQAKGPSKFRKRKK